MLVWGTPSVVYVVLILFSDCQSIFALADVFGYEVVFCTIGHLLPTKRLCPYRFKLWNVD